MARIPVISIVDDDPSAREATRRLVKSLGFSAFTFSSAEEFLESNRIADTACLITDVQMPGLTGVELQARLIARGDRMPVIFVTAFPADEIRAQVLGAGAIGLLSKPFQEQSLISCLDAALKSGKSTPED